MIPCFYKDFWEIKVLIQNRNQIGVFFKQTSSINSSDILTIQKKKPDEQPKHYESTSKLSFGCIFA
jgi:hypothetical protein